MTGRGLSDRGLRQVLTWLVLVLLLVPIGGALWLGFVHGESPCILCWAERTSMLLNPDPRASERFPQQVRDLHAWIVANDAAVRAKRVK